MALRCYFPETEAAAVSPTIDTAAGQWDSGHTGSQVRRRLRFDADSSTLTSTAYTPDGADHAGDYNTHHRQYVSDSLPAQTIPASTWKCQFQGIQPNANCNQRLTVKIYVVSSDGGTVRGVLSAISRDGDNEWATSLTNRAFSGNISELAIQADDRLVVEVGTGGSPGSGSGVQGHNATIRFGCNASTGDLPEDDSSALTTRRPWLEFSANIVTNAVAGADTVAVALGERAIVDITAAIQDADTLAIALGETGATESVASAPAFRSKSSNHNFGSSSVSVNVPSGMQTGDVLVAFVAISNNATYCTTSDFSTQKRVPGSDMTLEVLTRVVDGTEGTSFDFGGINSNDVVVFIACYMGVDTDAPVDGVDGQSNASSTDIVATSISPASSPDRLVGGFLTHAGGVSISQSVLTDRGEDNTDSGNSPMTLEVADQALSSSGATGTRTGVADGAAVNIGILIALKGSGLGPTPVSDVDTLAVALGEAASVLAIVAVQDADALRVALAEASSVDTGAPTPVSDADALRVGLVVGVIETDITLDTNLRVSLGEAASIAAVLATADTVALRLTEATSIAAVVAAADALGISLSEAAVVVGSAVIQAADALGVRLSEAAVLIITATLLDALAIGLVETAGIVGTAQSSDTVAMSLTEAARVLVLLQQQADALSISLAEAASIAMGVTTVQDADALAVALGELASLFGAVLASDAANVALAEATPRLQVTLQQGDTGVVLLTERADLQVSLAAALDALAVGLVEAAQLAVVMRDLDTLAISFGEFAWYTGVGLLVDVDRLGIGLAEGTVGLLAFVQPADTVAVALGERIPPILVTVADRDPLLLTLLDQVSIFVTSLSQETLTVSLQEGVPAIGQVSYLQAADRLGIALGEAAAVALALQRADALGIRLSEVATVAATMLAVDALALGLTEGTAALLVTQAVADSLGITLTEAESLVGTLRDVEALGVSLATVVRLVTAIQDVDALAVALREAAGSVYAVTHLVDRDLLAIRFEEVAAILATTPGQVGRAIVATLVSQVPERTLTPANLYDVIGPLRWPYTVERV